MIVRWTIGGFAALLFASAAFAAPAAKPQRVMSLNFCADQLLLQLVEPSRIVSLSFLSLTSGKPYISAESAHLPVNYGTLEEVLAAKPDLVLAGAVSTPTTRVFLQRSAIARVDVPMASNFGEIRRVTRLIGHAVGEAEKAEALIAKMDATLADLAANPLPRHIVVAGWGSGGDVPGKDTLFNAILTAAGGVNVADTMRETRFGAFDFEQLLAVRPDAIAFPDVAADQPGLRREQIQSRLIRKLYAGRQIAYSETLYSCGLPQSADAAKDLHAALAAIASGPPR